MRAQQHQIRYIIAGAIVLLVTLLGCDTMDNAAHKVFGGESDADEKRLEDYDYIQERIDGNWWNLRLHSFECPRVLGFLESRKPYEVVPPPPGRCSGDDNGAHPNRCV